jgi:hypothetical protein
VPVTPDAGLRLAFLTTIVPSKESVAVVRETLRAAKRIRHRGMFDIWLLDEGDDPDVKAMCDELGIRHFTRKGIQRYNQAKGPFRARTKHGNYNSWIDTHGDAYDVLLSVDPDHVPLASFAERIVGYFRDPDVAYAIGPQCYKNGEAFVTRAAESQQFPFHSVIQRAANRYGTAMLVGTNNAIRITALRSIGGLSDSITEDMATGLMLHTTRNPATGRRWKSVHPGRAVRRRGAVELERLLQPAAALVARHLRDPLLDVLAALPAAVPRRDAALHADHDVLSVDGAGLAAGHRQHGAVPGAGGERHDHLAAALVRPVHRRDRLLTMAVHQQPAVQRQPVRIAGLTRHQGHAHVHHLGAHLRRAAAEHPRAPAGQIRGHAVGREQQQ